MEGRIDKIFRLSKEISDKLDRFMLYVPPPPESAKNIVTKEDIPIPAEPAPKVCLTPQVLEKTSERIDHLTKLVRAKELLPSRAGFSPLTDENLEMIRQIQSVQEKYKQSLSPRAIELINQFYFKIDDNKQVVKKYGYPVLSGDVGKSREDRESKIITLAKGNPSKGEKDLNLLEKYLLGPDIFEIWLSTTIIMKLLSPHQPDQVQEANFREFLTLKKLEPEPIFATMKINKAVEAYFDAALAALEQSKKNPKLVNPFSLLKKVDKVGPDGKITKEPVPNEEAFEKIRKIFEDNGMSPEDQHRILNYFKDDAFTDEFAALKKENEEELLKVYNDFLKDYRKEIFDFKVLQLYFEIAIKNVEAETLSPKKQLPPLIKFALPNFPELLKESLQKFKDTPLDSLADLVYNDLESQVSDANQKLFLKFLIDIFLLTTPSTDIFQKTVHVPSITPIIPVLMQEIFTDFKREQTLERTTLDKRRMAKQEVENKKATKENRPPNTIEADPLTEHSDDKLKEYLVREFTTKSTVIIDKYKLKTPITNIHKVLEEKALNEKNKKKVELDKKLPVFPPERVFYKEKYREEYNKFLEIYKQQTPASPKSEEPPKTSTLPRKDGNVDYDQLKQIKGKLFESLLNSLSMDEFNLINPDKLGVMQKGTYAAILKTKEQEAAKKKTNEEAPPKSEAPKPEAPKPEEIDYSIFSQGKTEIKAFLKTLTNDQLGSIDTDRIPTMKRGLILEEKQSRGMKGGGRYTRTTLRRRKKTKQRTQRRQK